MKCHKDKISMNKNGQSRSSSIESHRKRARYKRLLQHRKAQLIPALEAARLVEQKRNIFVESIPNDPTPFLQPTPWRPSNITTKGKHNTKKTIITKGMLKIKDFEKWLLNYIPPKPKVVDKVLESFKNNI